MHARAARPVTVATQVRQDPERAAGGRHDPGPGAAREPGRDRVERARCRASRRSPGSSPGTRCSRDHDVPMTTPQLYDAIGGAYPATRRTEPRIAAQIWHALGDAQTVLNVGAGTGSYEPADRDVTAVEPSAVMRGQRPPGSAPCVAAAAESLPFEDHSFDVAMAVSTVHHWGDPIAGLREMRRVAHGVVVLTFDTWDEPGWQDRFWLTRDYLPEFAALGPAEFPNTCGGSGRRDRRKRWSRCPSRGTALTACSRRTGADRGRIWRITSAVRCRCGTRVGPEAEQRAVRSLSDDLDSGRWAELNSDLADLDAADLGPPPARSLTPPRRARSTARRHRRCSSRAAGRASRRAGAMGSPHRSHTAVRAAPRRARRAASSSARSAVACFRTATSCARSNAMVAPSGSCSSSALESRDAATISSKDCWSVRTRASQRRPDPVRAVPAEPVTGERQSRWDLPGRSSIRWSAILA